MHEQVGSASGLDASGIRPDAYDAGGLAAFGSALPASATPGALSLASDADLAAALCARDPAALTEVFRRHRSSVARVVGASAFWNVDDVVQDVFLMLWHSPERFRPDRGGLGMYLRMVARGLLVDDARSESARHRRQHAQANHASVQDDVEGVVLGRVTAAQLHAALRILPMAERVPIEMAFFGGQSYREVAATLEESEGTVKSRIRRGLQRLHGALVSMGAVERD